MERRNCRPIKEQMLVNKKHEQWKQISSNGENSMAKK